MNILKISRSTKGQTLVELALIITLLLALLFGITEFGRGWYYSNTLTNGVRAGARLATIHKAFTDSKLNNGTSIINYTYRQIQQTIPVKPLNNNDPEGGIFINLSAYQSDNSIRGSATSTGSGGLSSLVKGDAIVVIVHYNFKPLPVAGNIVPALSGQRQLTRKASMYYEGS